MATEMETGRRAADERGVLHPTSQLSLPSEEGLVCCWAGLCSVVRGSSGMETQGHAQEALHKPITLSEHAALLPGPFPKVGIGKHEETHRAQCSLAQVKAECLDSQSGISTNQMTGHQLNWTNTFPCAATGFSACWGSLHSDLKRVLVYCW